MAANQRSASATFIIDLNLSPSTMNALLNMGFVTVEDVLNALGQGDDALLHVEGFHTRALVELKARLEERGFLPSSQATTPLEALGNILSREMQELEALQEEMASTIAVEVGPLPAPPPVKPQLTPSTARSPTWSEKVAPAHLGDRLRRGGAALRAVPVRYVALGGLILVGCILLVASVVLLTRRLAASDYQALDGENRRAAYPNGVVLSLAPELPASDAERLAVRVEAIKYVRLTQGEEGRAWQEAIRALPPHLVVQSDLYRFQARGERDQPVVIDVPLPPAVESGETLDLYTWTGERWEWLPGELHLEASGRGSLRTRVASLPDNLLIVQVNALSPVISTDWQPGDAPPDTLAYLLSEVNPTGLFLSADGGLFGDPNALPSPATYAVLPAVRNWAPDATVNRGLLLDVLTIPAIQQAHIANLIQLCVGRGFAGVEIDYRGVTAAEREAYSAFITALADALHAHGLRLNVVVEPATRADGGWETGGYNWARIGAAADVLKVPFPADPAAYGDGGEAQQLLEWAVRQVNRHKLRMQVSSLSAEQSREGVRYITLEQSLAPFGHVTALDGQIQVMQGAQVAFGLAGSLISVTPLDAAGTYRLEYQADGETRVTWPGTATSLFTRLTWARRYQLGGVAVPGLLAPGNAPDVAGAVVAYRTRVAGPAPLLLQVVWTVTSPSAIVDQGNSPLTAPGYTWTVLAASGEYTVRATIAGFSCGSLPITVLPPQPAATEPVTPTETPAPVTVDCLAARYVADVTLPDYTAVAAGQELIKTWRVQNSGTCIWPAETVLARIQSQLGGPESVTVGQVGVGETVDVSIPLVAPVITGTFNGLWALQAGGVEIPGGRLTAVVQVTSSLEGE